MTKGNKPTNETLGFIEDEDGALRIDDIIIPPPPVATLSHDVPDKRFIIVELIVRNFKSYAGEIALGPFDKNFTAVVGPNGSGKSNVIDSLLFVFGYRAKKIRSKKVSHLIHKSDQYPNVNSCTVTVHFAMIKEKGDDDYEILPNTKLILSRTAFADDTSFYEINNKRAPYKEVARTLRKYGVDLEHSRFLILQGEIEAISLMNPKAQNEHETGMLEYIEDIIGSNRYIEPIQKFQEKLEQLNEEKKVKFNALKLVERERDELEGPKNKAIEGLRLENKLVLCENSLHHCKRWTIEKELTKITENKNQSLEELNKVKSQMNEVKESKKCLEFSLQKLNSELDIHYKEFEKCKESYKSLERQDVAMHEEIKHLKTKKEKAENILASTKNDLSKLNKQIEIYQKETEELATMKTKLEAEKSVEDKKMSESMDCMQEKTNNIQEQKDKFEAQLVKKEKEAHHLKSERDLLQSELDIYLSTDKKEKQALSNLISSHEAAQKSAKEEEILLHKENDQILNTESELGNLQQHIVELQQKESALSEQLKSSILKYEEAKNSLSTFKHRSGLLQAFAREKANGRLTGVYGRLGDLGAIDEKYDVAISTACGQLDNIVTDTLDTAQKCVEFLKRNNLGYTTFIPLDKMTQWIPYAHNRISTPENVHRLFDLVRVKDQNILPAFYFALRDTLVANDLEQATRIGLQGKRRYRVVTLKGELIDLAGTMSGGGGRVSKGRMGQTVVECTHSPQEVSKIGNEVDRLTRSMSEIKKSIANLQEQVVRKTKELPSLKFSIKKRQSNYKAYIASVQMLTVQIEEQKKKMELSMVDEEKVKELKGQIKMKNESYSSVAKEAAAIKENVTKHQEEILKITKGTLTKMKKNIDQLTKKISEASQSLTKSSVNMKTCKKNIKKAEEKVKNLEKDLESIYKSRSELNANRDSTVVQAREFLSRQEEAQTRLEKLKEKKTEVKKELDILNEKEHQMKITEIKHKNELKELEAAESEKKSFIKSINVKLSKLKMREVEDDPTQIPSYTPEEIEKLSYKRLSSELEIVKAQLEDMKMDINSISEFKKKELLCADKQKDLDEILHEKNMQSMRYEELRKRRLSEFMGGFTAIAKKLKEIYQMLTLGGDAEMELVDTFDPFLRGIEFSVRPPRKSWKFMRNLSGGEKTLSSLALVFALHYYRPTPFYVMDEIDAALDIRNVAIVGYYLKKTTKNTQFIIVSLRNIMNELSDHLIGIYKTDNCSKKVSIRFASMWLGDDEDED